MIGESEKERDIKKILKLKDIKKVINNRNIILNKMNKEICKYAKNKNDTRISYRVEYSFRSDHKNASVWILSCDTFL